MANRTAKDAATVKGTNPQYLIEKIIRTRIYDSMYWKEKSLGAMYIRLTFTGIECYKYLEPLYNDYRKLRYMDRMGTLEETDQLEIYSSALDEDLENLSTDSEEEEIRKEKPRIVSRRRSRSTSRERTRRRSRERNRSRDRDASRERKKERDPERRRDDKKSKKDEDSERRRDDKKSIRNDEDKNSRKRTTKDDGVLDVQSSNELRAKLGLAPLQK